MKKMMLQVIIFILQIDITNLNIEETPDKFGLVYVEDGILSFTYNGEEFNFDVNVL